MAYCELKSNTEKANKNMGTYGLEKIILRDNRVLQTFFSAFSRRVPGLEKVIYTIGKVDGGELLSKINQLLALDEASFAIARATYMSTVGDTSRISQKIADDINFKAFTIAEQSRNTKNAVLGGIEAQKIALDDIQSKNLSQALDNMPTFIIDKPEEALAVFEQGKFAYYLNKNGSNLFMTPEVMNDFIAPYSMRNKG